MAGYSEEGQDCYPAIPTAQTPLQQQVKQNYSCTICKCLCGEMSSNVLKANLALIEHAGQLSANI